MKTRILNRSTALVCALGHLALSPIVTAAPAQTDWQQLTTVGGNSHWSINSDGPCALTTS